MNGNFGVNSSRTEHRFPIEGNKRSVSGALPDVKKSLDDKKSIPEIAKLKAGNGEKNVNVEVSSKKSVCTGFKEACAELICCRKTGSSCVMTARCMMFYGLQLAAGTAATLVAGSLQGSIGYFAGGVISACAISLISFGSKCMAERGRYNSQGYIPIPNDFQNWLPCYKKV